MLKIERILCPTDFSEFSEKAYDYALSLARHYGSEVLLQHVVRPLTLGYPEYAIPDSVGEFYGELRGHAEEQLREFAKVRTQAGPSTRVIVDEGAATDCILALAKEQAVDLIVMGTHGRRGFERLALGSVTEKVLRKSTCSVLVVRKQAHDFVVPAKGGDSILLRKILFCSDFSECSARSLQYALSLAAEYQAELSLLHVLEHAPAPSELQAETERARKRLEEPITAEARSRCKIDVIVRVGKPHEEIVRAAQEAQTELVIVGVRGRNALDLALFGSTTHRVIQLGTWPVLAVHI